MEYHFSSTGTCRRKPAVGWETRIQVLTEVRVVPSGQYGPYAQHCGHSGVRYASRMPRDASFGFHHLPAEHSTPSLPQEFFEWDNQRRFLRSNGLGNTLYTLNNFIDDPFEVEEPEPDNLPHQATGSIDPSRSPIAIKNTQEATTPGSEKKFKCTVCGKTFARKQRLEACQNKHQGERPYICGGLCGVKPWYLSIHFVGIRI